MTANKDEYIPTADEVFGILRPPYDVPAYTATRADWETTPSGTTPLTTALLALAEARHSRDRWASATFAVGMVLGAAAYALVEAMQ